MQSERKTDQYNILATEDGPDSTCRVLWPTNAEPTSPPRSAFVRHTEDGIEIGIVCDSETVVLVEVDADGARIASLFGLEVEYRNSEGKCQVATVNLRELDY